MREVMVEDGLTVRFPGRSVEFLEGVDIGLLIADLAAGHGDITRRIRRSGLKQAADVANGFGYRCTTVAEGDDWIEINVTNRRRRPVLRVV
ncbi:hypothetical protein [Chthonobacter rhizosphaerae]|uniref:hypothetical protein n=1 Tax=Chthonobacter rhizosphaerae TaxID=2735553 RepID=UPI0015EF22CD|nr:hypothetical protein [Chthonobacter rhizosphaerae]